MSSKKAKSVWVLLAVGLIGAIGVIALPFSATGLRALSAPDGHGYVLLGAFVVPAALAAWGLVAGMARWQAVICLLAYLVAGMKSAGDEGGPGQTIALFMAFIGMIVAFIPMIRQTTEPRQA